MRTITVEEAQLHLAEVIEKLQPGEELVITREGRPIATLQATPPTPERERKPRQFGTLKGTVLYMAPDFDAIPEGFEEYVE